MSIFGWLAKSFSREKTVLENRDKAAFGFAAMNEDKYMYSNGLSKREYFAGLAMQAILSREDYVEPKAAAVWAIQSSDATLKELEDEVVK